jgi:endonuclease/exonuclease/phosphatase family metal-dependent hydrolase
LSEAEEVFCDARQMGRALLFDNLAKPAGRLLGLPVLRGLRPMARRLRAVSEPVGRALMRRRPPSLRTGASNVVTVLSANLWHDWPRHRRLAERLEALARLIEAEAVDVALLQEVARTPDIRADEWLADRLGMAYIYTRANGHEAGLGFEEGLAILSRFALARPRVRQLEPTPTPFVHRVGLGADVQTSSGPLATYSVHLGILPRQNAAQLDSLRRWVGAGSRGRAALIGGDFNAHENTPQIVRAQRIWLDIFRHLHPDSDGSTHVLRWPWGARLCRSRLDYLFLQPGGKRWRVLEADHLDGPDGPHSDHLAVLARLAPEG